jgi:hypothetical protein
MLDTGHLVVAESLNEISGRYSFASAKWHQVRRIKIPAFLWKRCECTWTR